MAKKAPKPTRRSGKLPVVKVKETGEPILESKPNPPAETNGNNSVIIGYGGGGGGNKDSKDP